MDRSRPRAGLAVVLVISVMAATMAGIVARAAPASAARRVLGVARSSLTIVDPTRSTPPRGPHGWLPSRTLPTSVFAPDQPGPWPLLVFAHGFAINPEAYAPLLEAWAAAGYVVAAPEFPISGSDLPGAPRRDDIPEQARDLSAVIDVLTDPGRAVAAGYGGLVDPARVGAAGHSDGGITVAALAYNSATIDRRVRATVSLAGEVPIVAGGVNGPFNPGAFLAVAGTLDEYVDAAAARAVYDLAAAPKAFITLPGAAHLPPYVTDPTFAPTVWAATIGFLDARVRDDPSGLARLAQAGSVPGVSSMEQIGLAPNPVGQLDAVTADRLGPVRLSGWALDPDTSDPVTVHVYADGALQAPVVASGARPDIGAVFPDFGSAHGFSAAIDGLEDGPHTVCAYALQAGPGDANTWLGCRTVRVDRNPIGVLDAVTSDARAHVHVRGWMLDPDTAGAGTVHVYVDGALAAVAPAGAPRADLALAFPGYGAEHGFDVDVVDLAQGSHTVCVYAMNVDRGSANPWLGCRAVGVDHEPFGALDETTVQVGGGLHVGGWAVDPDRTSPVAVHVYLDGVLAASGPADTDRPDIDAALPGAGAAHGYAFDLPPVAEGPHTVCAYGINEGAGVANRLLGRCATVRVGHGIVGLVDAVVPTPEPGISVVGWVLDPDTVDPIGVHVYVDGVFTGAGLAGVLRGDIGVAFPAYGPAHGFAVTVPTPAGVHTVCAYGIDVGPGDNTLLGCRTVAVI